MILTILFAVVASAPPARCDVAITVFEAKTAATSTHCVGLDQIALVKTGPAAGPVLAPTDIYAVKNGRLVHDATVIADATEILAQARAGHHDVVVLRNEYNSFSNPLRVLSAFLGHPVQVSEIAVLLLREGRVIKRWRLAREASSYEWRADLRVAG
jgi:hypothetical protein